MKCSRLPDLSMEEIFGERLNLLLLKKGVDDALFYVTRMD